jgi:hypothetical protein
MSICVDYRPQLSRINMIYGLALWPVYERLLDNPGLHHHLESLWMFRLDSNFLSKSREAQCDLACTDNKQAVAAMRLYDKAG